MKFRNKYTKYYWNILYRNISVLILINLETINKNAEEENQIFYLETSVKDVVKIKIFDHY